MYYMRMRKPITDTLLRTISESGMSFKALEKATGVKRQSLMKFARREQTLRGDFMDALAAYFSLVLVKSKKGKG